MLAPDDGVYHRAKPADHSGPCLGGRARRRPPGSGAVRGPGVHIATALELAATQRICRQSRSAVRRTKPRGGGPVLVDILQEGIWGRKRFCRSAATPYRAARGP